MSQQVSQSQSSVVFNKALEAAIGLPEGASAKAYDVTRQSGLTVAPREFVPPPPPPPLPPLPPITTTVSSSSSRPALFSTRTENGTDTKHNKETPKVSDGDKTASNKDAEKKKTEPEVDETESDNDDADAVVEDDKPAADDGDADDAPDAPDAPDDEAAQKTARKTARAKDTTDKKTKKKRKPDSEPVPTPDAKRPRKSDPDTTIQLRTKVQELDPVLAVGGKQEIFQELAAFRRVEHLRDHLRKTDPSRSRVAEAYVNFHGGTNAIAAVVQLVHTAKVATKKAERLEASLKEAREESTSNCSSAPKSDDVLKQCKQKLKESHKANDNLITKIEDLKEQIAALEARKDDDESDHADHSKYCEECQEAAKASATCKKCEDAHKRIDVITKSSEKRIDDLKKELDETKAAYKAITEKRTVDAKNDRVKSDAEFEAKANKRIAELTKANEDASAAKAKLETEAVALNKQLFIMSEKVTASTLASDALEKYNNSLRGTVASCDARHKEDTIALAEMKNRLDRQNAALRAKEDELKSYMQLHTSAMSGINGQLAAKVDLLRVREAALESLDRLARDQREQIQSYHNHVASLNQQAEELKRQIVAIKADANDHTNKLTGTVASLKGENAQLVDANSKLKAALDETRSKSPADSKQLEDTIRDLQDRLGMAEQNLKGMERLIELNKQSVDDLTKENAFYEAEQKVDRAKIEQLAEENAAYEAEQKADHAKIEELAKKNEELGRIVVVPASPALLKEDQLPAAAAVAPAQSHPPQQPTTTASSAAVADATLQPPLPSDAAPPTSGDDDGWAL